MSIRNDTKRREFALEAIHKQFELAGVDPSVLETDKHQWFTNNTMTLDQHAEWKKWFIEEARKRFKLPKKACEREFAFFDLGYGLRINYENSTTKSK